jgi:hypothetical protein
MVVFLRSSRLPSTAIALVIALVVAYSPGRATAGCGDYVIVVNPKASAEPESTEPFADSRVPAGPCRGPTCSNQVPAPFAPVPLPVGPPSDAKACFVGSVDDVGSDVERTPHSLFTGVPVHRPNLIFHPPRV